MIPPGKLSELNCGQRRRKLALCFGSLERDIAGIAEKGSEYHFPSMTRTEYTKKLAEILLTDPELEDSAREKISSLLDAKKEDFDERRLCNTCRNALLAIIGTFPAEWDLVIAPHNSKETEGHEKCSENATYIKERNFFPGVYVFAEDIRSPFNLGSIFRTAEAMGAEKVFISEDCVDPSHPRAVRSGMGCIENLEWERVSLLQLSEFAVKNELPVFALETGGKKITEFEFPKRGIVIIGSEELGISPDALRLCRFGTATIPMKGIKASLNVGVAFGILMQEWVRTL